MPQLILAVHASMHDAAAAVYEDYTLRAAVQLERLTRVKNDGGAHPDLAIDEALSIAGATRKDVDVVAHSRDMFAFEYYRNIRWARWIHWQYRKHAKKLLRRHMIREILMYKTTDIDAIFDVPAFRRASGLRDEAVVHFHNHHEAHALAPLFSTRWDDALIVTADGFGDTVCYSHRVLANGGLETIHGGEDCTLAWPPTADSMGEAYAAMTGALGFVPQRHEGKLTGLAARGRPVLAERIAARFRVDESGRIFSDFPDVHAMRGFIGGLAAGVRREDAAASIQQVLEDTMLLSIGRLLARHKSRRLALAGGVFANVRLNRLLAERLPIDEIFIYPAMGDEGVPAGGALCYLLQRDGLAHWLAQRRPLRDVYLGRDYSDAIDATLTTTTGVRRTGEPPIEGAAHRLAVGQIGAIYTGRMEYGPRALGARSILANPARRETHDLLNTRLARSEFMPFAPVVRAERAASVFDVGPVNAYACRFMTIACNVKPEWRERIAAVVHVDGSARPQVIEREANPLYYDILCAFEHETGLPVLVNTSFNVHEEPIVNKPSECVQALLDGRIDFVVTTRAIYDRIAPTAPSTSGVAA
jgi:carbamoyltransferase